MPPLTRWKTRCWVYVSSMLCRYCTRWANHKPIKEVIIQQRQDHKSMLVYGWPSVYDAGPTSNQHWFFVFVCAEQRQVLAGICVCLIDTVSDCNVVELVISPNNRRPIHASVITQHLAMYTKTIITGKVTLHNHKVCIKYRCAQAQNLYTLVIFWQNNMSTCWAVKSYGSVTKSVI